MLENVIVAPVQPDGSLEDFPAEIHLSESDETYGKIVIEPLKEGHGITIGNPMRRILLSSIKGSAITQVKIRDVVHEYSAIPGVKEEVMDLLLNIKRIRINSPSMRDGKMRLEVMGQGPVCAGDISTSEDFHIVNPELHLATLDSDDASLSIEFDVGSGFGYRAVEEHDPFTARPVGVMPLDAVFSPVRKVNYSIERTRRGEKTNLERLVLDVWTDGTISPLEAVRQAADELSKYFQLFISLNREGGAWEMGPTVQVSPEIYQMPIERLDLSPRTLNCLKRAHITRVGEVLEKSGDELLKIRNFGEKSLEELQEKLSERGISGYPRSFGPGSESGEAQAATATVVGLADLAEAWNQTARFDEDAEELEEEELDNEDEEDTE